MIHAKNKAPRKPILNSRERIAYDRLIEVCQKHSATIWAQIRLLDAIGANQNTMNRLDYDFCMQAHLDFLVVDIADLNPLFAVEFDGPTHKEAIQVRRDDIKNRVCREHALSLLRITDKHIKTKYRSFDALSYLVSYWFISRDIERAGEADPQIRDQYFDPEDMFVDPGKPFEIFPYQLDWDAARKLDRARHRKVIESFTFWYGQDKVGRQKVIAYAHLPNGRVVYRYSLMWQNGFGMVIDQRNFLKQVATVNLAESIDRYQAGIFRDFVSKEQWERRFEHLKIGFESDQW